jgi:hypothetical protein
VQCTPYRKARIVEKRDNHDARPSLPPCATEYISLVVRKVRYRKKVRRDIEAELTAHFEDELRDYMTDEERDAKARQVIEGFGDPKLLAILCRRAKKRCRPLWVRAFRGAFKLAGVFVLVFIPYAIWFASGQAKPTIDYLTQLNALKGNVPPGDNAWPNYERALRLFVPPPEGAKVEPQFNFPPPGGVVLTAEQRTALADWISINQLSWLQFEFATQRRICHRVYHKLPGRDLLMSCMDDPPLANLRLLAVLGRWKSRLALEQGHTDEALAHCLTIVRAGAHWQMSRFLIEQLLGIALTGAGCQEIVRIVASNEMSPAQLSELQNHLAEVYSSGYPYPSYEGERLIALDMVQRAFTDGGPGGGHRVVEGYAGDLAVFWGSIGDPGRVNILDVNLPDRRTIRRMMPAATVLGMIHASRNKTSARINQIYDKFEAMASLSPYERLASPTANSGQMPTGMAMLRYPMPYMIVPAEQRVSVLTFRAKADYQAALTVVALARYQRETGSYPPSLRALVDAGYLESVPMDPFSDKPFVYRLTDTGFWLYSVGENSTDDGGVQGKGKGGRSKAWQDNGDNVFWPVSQSPEG